ncbi:hypothetical protein ACI65C_003108 [Semiaphis heraclei]
MDYPDPFLVPLLQEDVVTPPGREREITRTTVDVIPYTILLFGKKLRRRVKSRTGVSRNQALVDEVADVRARANGHTNLHE